MIFRAMKVAGAFAIDLERHTDDRGSFARAYCAREFAEQGLDPRLLQCSLSSNLRKGTLRGMHYSVPPHAEAKVVRCVRGGIYDVVVDLRTDSPTFRAWAAEVLTADNGRAVYVPEGVAHGFLTIEDTSDVLYQMSEFYNPACARAVRWNDPALGIAWPEEPTVMSDRDRTHADLVQGRR